MNHEAVTSVGVVEIGTEHPGQPFGQVGMMSQLRQEMKMIRHEAVMTKA
jgi:hypothetical protein